MADTKKATLINELELTFTKSTAGTHVYANMDFKVQFYIPKSFITGEPPKTVKLTVSQ